MPISDCNNFPSDSLMACCSGSREEMIEQVNELISVRPQLAYLLADYRYITEVAICGDGFFNRHGVFIKPFNAQFFDPSHLFKYKIVYQVIGWEQFVVFN